MQHNLMLRAEISPTAWSELGAQLHLTSCVVEPADEARER